MVGLRQPQETPRRTPMKIVQVSPYSMDRPGGVQAHIRDLSAWLHTQGHEVRIVSPPGTGGLPGSLALGGFRNMKLHGTAFEISRAARSELQSGLADLRSWGAEVVHLHTPWTPMLAWQVWRGLALPSIGTFHATLPDGGGFDPFRWYIRKAARRYHRKLDTIIVPSDAPLSQWKALGVDPAPTVLPPAIDLSRWRAAKASHKGGPHLVFMGRLEERKGAQVLLEAWEQISSALPVASLTIAGQGELEATLRGYAQNRQLPRVRFLPPPSDQEAPALVASADFFMAPATGGESFGLVLIEAMSAGALPIAAANSGYATVLTDQGRELLVPPADPSSLAQKTIDLASNPDLCTQLRNWARDHSASFDVSVVGPKLEHILQQAISNQS